MVVYLRANQASLDKVIKRLMLQQFAYLTNLNTEDKWVPYFLLPFIRIRIETLA